jgi:hypothetical protein
MIVKAIIYKTKNNIYIVRVYYYINIEYINSTKLGFIKVQSAYSTKL